jgi:transposase-like protein
MGEGLKRIFGSDTAKDARQRFDELAEQMEKKASKAIDCLEHGLEDSLAVMALPGKYRKRLKSTNMQERLIQEIRRRERVVRIFPNEASALRLMGALLAEIHEEWQGRRYLAMDDFHEWLAEQSDSTEEAVVSIC